MLYYECYLYRSDGTICGASPLFRDGDLAAMEVARQIFAHRDDAHSIELWQDDRQVHIQAKPAAAS